MLKKPSVKQIIKWCIILITLSLISGLFLKYSIPVAIAFLCILVMFFNNPFIDESKQWMALALLGMIGGLISLLLIELDD